MIGATTVTELFRKECEVPGYVRAVHAVEALNNPDASERYSLNETTIVLATRRVVLGHAPYSLLVIAFERQAGHCEIQLAFRVYDDSKANDVDLRPLAVFEKLLMRYGTTVYVGDQSGLLIPAARVKSSESGHALVRAAAPKKEKYLVHALLRPDTVGFTDVAWVFALSTSVYGADVHRHSR